MCEQNSTKIDLFMPTGIGNRDRRAEAMALSAVSSVPRSERLRVSPRSLGLAFTAIAALACSGSGSTPGSRRAPADGSDSSGNTGGSVGTYSASFAKGGAHASNPGATGGRSSKTSRSDENSAGAGASVCTPNGYARNPIVSHIFTADPSAKVFEDRVYVYASHDLDDQSDYDMTDYHVFSSDDLVNWQDHGVALDVADVPWASSLYAPDACYGLQTGKYYLYFPDGGSAIGVAVSDRPSGPFVDALGKPLITRSTPGVSDVEWVFDPTCFVDDDGQAYLYFGGGMPDTGKNARVIRLGADMISLADNAATTIDAPDFFEASFMHKRHGRYYFSYSTTFADHAAHLDYMTSDDPMTGFQYEGTLIGNPAEDNGNNNHGSVVEHQGNWYLFYHTRILSNRLGLSDYQRSITLDNLTYDEQGRINQVAETQGRVEQLKCVDAFSRMEAETMAAQSGIEVEFATEGSTTVGVNVTQIHDKDWIGYSQVNFAAGASTFVARVAKGVSVSSAIELVLDGCDEFTGDVGQLVGVCTIPDTGGWQSWVDVRCEIERTAGAHDVCLRFTGDGTEHLFNLDYFQFE